MDLNQLYFDQQLSSMRAAAAVDFLAQENNRCRADLIGRQIERYQTEVSASAAATWSALRKFNASDAPHFQ